MKSIPRVYEESVLPGFAFTSNFSPSLALCKDTKPLAREEKIWAGSLGNSRFFNPSRYIPAILAFFLFLSQSIQAAPPDWLSFGAGVYDFMRPRHITGEFEIEYKFHVRSWGSPMPCLEFLPLVGVMTNFKRAGYIYAGLNFDFTFFDHLLFAPGFAAGYYWPGKGKNLGFPLEFRSGIEIAWQFSDYRRLGVHFYHLSNASLGKRNPGEESFVLYYDIPIVKGFPFSSDRPYTARD